MIFLGELGTLCGHETDLWCYVVSAWHPPSNCSLSALSI